MKICFYSNCKPIITCLLLVEIKCSGSLNEYLRRVSNNLCCQDKDKDEESILKISFTSHVKIFVSSHHVSNLIVLEHF